MAPPKGGFAPNLDKFLDTLKSRPVEASVELLIQLLKRRQIQGSEPCATATAYLLLQVVARDRWTDVDQLIARILTVGRSLVAAQPRELVIGNIVKRVLQLVRGEAEEDRNEAGSDSISDLRTVTPVPTPAPQVESSPQRPARPPTLNSLGSYARTQSMFNILADPDLAPFLAANGIVTSAAGSGTSTPHGFALSTNLVALKEEVIGGIDEIMDEIKQVDEQVQAYSDIIIHPGDYILVYKPSRTVQKFLTRSKRKTTVFLVVDPSQDFATDDAYSGFRKSLSANGCTLVNVLNTGLMAYMSRVNKVILGARAMSAKGDVIVDSGAAVIARAAQELGRTVIVLGAVYKISPIGQLNQDVAIEWGDPSKYVSFSDGRMVGQVRVKNAASEFVPAELIDTYITNLGAHSRDHLHTLVEDHYNAADIAIDLHGKIRV